MPTPDAVQPPTHDFTSFTSRSVGRLQLRDLLIGCAALALWILLFSGGVLIGTEPYRAKLSSMHLLSWGELFWTGVVVISCYTVTNVAILCCLGSLLGGIYRGSTKREAGAPADSLVVGMRLLPYLIQGFVIYLLLISGLFLLGEDPFQNLTANRYIRLAGSASLFSFLAGYKPRVFYTWLERFDAGAAHNRKHP